MQHPCKLTVILLEKTHTPIPMRLLIRKNLRPILNHIITPYIYNTVILIQAEFTRKRIQKDLNIL